MAGFKGGMQGGMRGGMRGGPKGGKGLKHLDVKALKRLIGILLKDYKSLFIVILACIGVSAVASSMGGLFLNKVYSALETYISGVVGASETWSVITSALIVLGCIYLINVTCSYLYSFLGAILTQRFLRDMRNRLFEKMQKLPIKYFDTHTHGDIMSTYTNDIDALRQLVSQSLPQLLSTIITLITLTIVMLYISVILFLVVVAGIVSITYVTKLIGGNSAKYFMAQQQAVGKAEGYIEEMMNGQKVVKVFNHEEQSKQKFKELNDNLCYVSNKANAFSNMLMPIIHNIGNILYVLTAFLGGGIFILTNGTGINISLQDLFTTGNIIGLMKISTVVSFLGMARRFANTTGQISNQINSVVMAVAGSNRIFRLLDEKEEEDEGYVTLVKVKEQDGNFVETEESDGFWAWKHPHKADGTITYTKLAGDVVLENVDFGYTEDRIVLHDVSLYAKPGQKVAFVGATGAGKTTITNLINRFYDIADGKIRYDNINVNKIKKADLRKSLGIVLQDVSLFSGTIMDNIRYGKLDATDEECINACKLASADDFISRLPDGYNTYITGDGANFSQGQRQLLSIARAAVKNAPAMILDEATSSIDTRTELLVQQGTNRLMQGRTVFIIAHRLSTVKDADVIMVLDKGRIIERGSHEDLMEAKGTYYRLYTGNFEE